MSSRRQSGPTTQDGHTDPASLIAQVMSQLAATMDAEVAVARLARLLVPALADWCIVTLVEDDESRVLRRHLQDIGSWHAQAELRPLVREYASARLSALSDRSFLAQALNDGEVVEVRAGATAALHDVLAPGVAFDVLTELAPSSVAVVPLISRGRTLGALSLFNGAGREPLSADGLQALRDVATGAALVLDNARLYRRQRDVAETFQRSLLTAPVEPDHVQVVVRYQPAAEAARVGGDWYDAFMQQDGATVLVIGDVVGHDIEAAALMSQLRSMLRAIAVVTDEGPAAILTQLDAAIRTLQLPAMATVVVARIEQTADELARGITHLRWSSAGHLPPMVVNPDGTVLALTSLAAGPMLGVFPDARRVDNEVTLDRGATVLLYTDGLVESRHRPLREGLTELHLALERVGRADLDTLCDTLLTDLPLGPGEDDVALLGVRLHRQDRPRPASAGPNNIPPDVPDGPPLVDPPS